MAAEESFIFWVFTAIFGLAALAFAIIRNRRPSIHLVNTSNFFVSFITLVSYVIMALALATVTAENGEPIYWSRWLFYTASCSMLTVDIALIAGKTQIETLETAILTGLTMFCGFLASIITVDERWWFFVFSSAAYIGMLYTLFSGKTANNKAESNIMWFVLVTWSAFPLVWIMAPTGLGIISTYTEAILYGLLDLATKILFGLYLTLEFGPKT